MCVCVCVCTLRRRGLERGKEIASCMRISTLVAAHRASRRDAMRLPSDGNGLGEERVWCVEGD